MRFRQIGKRLCALPSSLCLTQFPSFVPASKSAVAAPSGTAAQPRVSLRLFLRSGAVYSSGPMVSRTHRSPRPSLPSSFVFPLASSVQPCRLPVLLGCTSSPATMPCVRLLRTLRSFGFPVAEARLAKQTTPTVLGLARNGDRFGLRCLAEDEEELHQAIRPDTPFLPQQVQHVVHSGPWPPGTQKAAISKLLSSLQWRARPVQPLPGSDANGTWWILHAATSPAQAVIHTQAGEVLLVEQHSKAIQQPAPPPAMVAARTTLQQFHAPPGLDPLSQHDPSGRRLPPLSTNLFCPPQLRLLLSLSRPSRPSWRLRFWPKSGKPRHRRLTPMALLLPLSSPSLLACSRNSVRLPRRPKLPCNGSRAWRLLLPRSLQRSIDRRTPCVTCSPNRCHVLKSSWEANASARSD